MFFALMLRLEALSHVLRLSSCHVRHLFLHHPLDLLCDLRDLRSRVLPSMEGVGDETLHDNEALEALESVGSDNNSQYEDVEFSADGDDTVQGLPELEDIGFDDTLAVSEVTIEEEESFHSTLDESLEIPATPATPPPGTFLDGIVSGLEMCDDIESPPPRRSRREKQPTKKFVFDQLGKGDWQGSSLNSKSKSKSKRRPKK